jgi:hypothetical protein
MLAVAPSLTSLVVGFVVYARWFSVIAVPFWR